MVILVEEMPELKVLRQKKKKKENRSVFQETLKRDFIKEKNYLIFQLREGEDRCSFDAIGEILDNLGLTESDVVSIAEILIMIGK